MKLALPSPQSAHSSSQSFLPDDYVQRKAERRRNFASLVLFCVVMFGVVAAFFVTNRQWAAVKVEQRDINVQYAAEAKKIEELKKLETTRSEMIEKAEITQALLERVPRSILLAEIINRMPENLTLTEFKLVGKRVIDAPPTPAGRKGSLAGPANRGTPAAPAKGGAAAAANTKPPAPKPPRFEFTIELVGLAADDEQVADFHTNLKQCPLLQGVDLIASGEAVVDDVARRKFRIETRIAGTADARQIDPLKIPRGGVAGGQSFKPAAGWMRRSGLFGNNADNPAPTPEGEAQPTVNATNMEEE